MRVFRSHWLWARALLEARAGLHQPTNNQIPQGGDDRYGNYVPSGARFVPCRPYTIGALSGAMGPIIGQKLWHGSACPPVRHLSCCDPVFGNGCGFGFSHSVLARGTDHGAMFKPAASAKIWVYLLCGPLALVLLLNAVIFVTSAGFNNPGPRSIPTGSIRGSPPLLSCRAASGPECRSC